ncbi:MAG: ABC transporter ATP-binding protein, partial [Clostridia bacterium]|nr:ABC transporter ATP-binding protein [Clostridia bacterium]
MLKTLISQVKECKRDSLTAPALTMLEAVLELVIPLLMASMIDAGISRGDMNAVYRYGAWMLLAAALSLLLGVLAGGYASRASMGYARNLREGMYRSIQRFSFSNIDKYSTAGLVTRLTTDVTNLQNAYQMILRMCVRAPVMLIFALIMAFSISHRLSLIFVAAIVFLAVCLGFIMVKAMGMFERVFQKYDELNAGVQENVSAIRAVKAFVRETFETEKFKKATQTVYDLFVRAEKVLSFNNPAMMLSVYGCILALSWFGAKMVVGGDLTTGQLTSLFSYISSILISLMMLSMVFVMVAMSLASMHRIAEVLREEPDIQSPEHACHQIPDGSVAFENVSFSYRQGDGESVLNGITLHVNAGETVGIIGATGSAKSSLVSLLSRLYDVTGGRVTVGGRDVREYDLHTLRNAVSVVLQKNILFSGTVLENLRWGKEDAGEEECRRACRLACADEFIEGLPNGYQTQVERGGVNFSGGQKQRLCIARAL